MINGVERRLGNYLLTRLVGRGGFADVYHGEHIYLKTPAAIKVLNVYITGDEHEKFLTEARVAARLEHPHIVSVLEFGIENKTPYLVMDYAAHGTLRQRYPRGTHLTPAQIAPYVQQIAEALQYTHDQQLVHRDIKPENMLLSNNDTLLLSDFGIALVVQNAQYADSKQHVVGTIAYMAPEQLRGDACPASDQYALGAVIYEWLCGEPPFYGSYTEVALQQAFASPMPLRERVPEIPADVEQVVTIALAKDPQSRFKSMRAFANAFARVCTLTNERSVVASLPDLLPVSSSASTQLTEPSTILQKETQPAKRLSRRALSTALLVGAGAVAGGALTWKPLSQALQTLFPASIAPGTTLYTYHGHSYLADVLAWLDRERIVTVADNIQIWYATTGKLDHIYRIETPDVTMMALSPDSRYIAERRGQPDNRVEIWIREISSGKKVYVYSQPYDTQITAIAWSPDSQFIASATDGNVIISVWRALSGELRSRYVDHVAPVNSIAWSPDGALIASADGSITDGDVKKGLVHIWEPTTGRKRLSYQGHPDPVTVVAWSPDGNRIASGSGTSSSSVQNSDPNNNTVQIWRPESGKALSIYHGHTGPVTTISWSPDGQRVVSGSNGGVASARVWDVNNGHTIYAYQGHNRLALGGVIAVAWSPDGELIASSGVDGTVQVWKAP